MKPKIFTLPGNILNTDSLINLTKVESSNNFI